MRNNRLLLLFCGATILFYVELSQEGEEKKKKGLSQEKNGDSVELIIFSTFLYLKKVGIFHFNATFIY